jgi:putative oxidoreductase
METTHIISSASVNDGLLMLRIVFGLLMAAHGAQKLFGWFGGYGLAGTGGYFEGLGFRPGRLFAAAAAGSEFGGGLLVALGLLGPVGPALIVGVMVVAIITVHWTHGVFAADNGVELPLLFAIAAVAVALIGPGQYSLDQLLGIGFLWTPVVTWGVLALGVLGGLANLALRRPATPHAPAV